MTGNYENGFDSVTYPRHYVDKQIEVIDYIRDTLTPEEFIGHCLGNVFKYASRWHGKGGVDDLKKAQVYLQWAIDAQIMKEEKEKDENHV